ncbi:xanthine dehydrogenase family protein molybdopterin-binding subunit [Marinoscillum furvescens]|uniref:Isoquinoline 1-oxidoreductase beta subunit n=1 Tax=Marinoscillum furvescens DSM 4134 TaxID=1122208 RepID=A0A3D9KYF9_MARFU|nr:molybdopterin cofactor-binding domain-containing protein [Marinoscillum furvescens]RED92211.1 isoquinoline 1-oxidoreductase beta subunit [Marinoscillum furvescens DSM 4134]
MTVIKTRINRRSFLKVSSAGSAGLMISFSWLASCTPGTKTLEIPEEWYDLNAYIKIGNNGVVTLFSPNPEIGQNVKTSMPMIIAEELDVDWKQVIVEQATLNTDKFDRQLAGGSQSIRHGWDGLRMAGATARRMLMEAAAKRWQVSVDGLTAEKGIITNPAIGDQLGYGDVALDASNLEVPEEVELKEIKDFQLIGKRVKNVDAKKIVTGQPLFGIDYAGDEATKVAMIVHPPAFGMKLKSMNDDEVKAMPGIHEVVRINTSLEEPQWSDTNAFNELVAVVGTTTWEVMKAKQALQLEWEADGSLENTTDHEFAMKDSMEQMEGHVAREDGDVSKAFAEADEIVERTYTAPFLAHNTMEPMNFYANVSADKAELVGPIQTPENLRESASKLLGIPEANITVDMTRMGGGFGRRLYGHFGLEAAAISQAIQGPVKLVYTREDDMTQGTYRPAYRVTYRAGLDKEKNLVAFEAKGTGIPGSPLFANRFPAGTVDYYKVTNYWVNTNISTGAWRAPRSNFTAGAEQAFLDEVAEAAGKDPIDFRLELFDRAIKNPVGEKNDYDPERYAGVLRAVREQANWGENKPGVYRGVAAYYCHNSYVAQVMDVVKDGDNLPKIQKIWCAVDCGIVVNLEGAINQVEGGMIDGIGHALYSQMTFENGTPQQNNFDGYRLIRNQEAQMDIDVHFVKNDKHPTGLGEPSLPPVIGALANALYQATGRRFYEQPFALEYEKVQMG